MANAPYMPDTDDGKRPWLDNFAAKLILHATTVGVSTVETNSVTADNDFFNYVCEGKDQYDQKAREWTAYTNGARSGQALGPKPVSPALGAGPALVAPNIFGRIAALVGRIKNHPGYTEAIGRDLGIIGAEQTVDLNGMKPVLKLTLEAGHPNVGWKKQRMGGLEIWVDRGEGFVFLAVDTVPDYLDTFALPAPGVSALWKYKAIYRLKDEQVGQWSDVSSITVMG